MQQLTNHICGVRGAVGEASVRFLTRISTMVLSKSSFSCKQLMAVILNNKVKEKYNAFVLEIKYLLQIKSPHEVKVLL